jgi:hypothetical protein
MPMTVAPAESRSAEPLAAPVFTVGDERYVWADVVLAGMRWGEWAELEEQAVLGLACRRRAEAEELVLDPEQVARAAADFRYARGLVTAEEMDGWLARWGLAADDWMGWIEGSILRRRWAGDCGARDAGQPMSQADMAAAVWTEGVCSGTLARLASTLAGRAAVAAAHETAEQSGEAARAVVDRGQDAVAAEVAQQGLGEMNPADCRRRLARLARIERGFGEFRVRTVTPRDLHEVIQARQLDWIRVQLRTASFDSEAPAREAALCVREDGETLADVARAAGAPVRATAAFLEELATDLRQRLLGARPQELLGPMRVGDTFALIEVIEKAPPTSDDPEVRRRAEDTVIRREAEREIERHVRWRIAL